MEWYPICVISCFTLYHVWDRKKFRHSWPMSVMTNFHSSTLDVKLLIFIKLSVSHIPSWTVVFLMLMIMGLTAVAADESLRCTNVVFGKGPEHPRGYACLYWVSQQTICRRGSTFFSSALPCVWPLKVGALNLWIVCIIMLVWIIFIGCIISGSFLLTSSDIFLKDTIFWRKKYCS